MNNIIQAAITRVIDTPLIGDLGNIQTPIVAKSKTECQCEYHCVVHPASEVYPHCQYNDNEPVFVDTNKNIINNSISPVEYTKEIVMEDGSFFIEKNNNDSKNFDKHESWVMHYCSSLYWKVIVVEEYMIKYGKCKNCHEDVPPGLIALWKMHNWDYLQNFAPGEELDEFDRVTCA